MLMIAFMLLLFTAEGMEFDTERQAQANDAALQSLENLIRYPNKPKGFDIGHMHPYPDGPKPLMFGINAESDLVPYGLGLASLMVYGIVPALLLILFAMFWCPCRTCGCCKCCKKDGCCLGQAQTHWNCLQRLLPIVVIAICGLVMTTFSALAYIENDKFADALFQEDDGIWFVLKDSFVAETGFFFDEISGQMDIIINASKPNGDIENYATSLRDNHEATIEAGNQPIIQKIDEFCNEWSNKYVKEGLQGYKILQPTATMPAPGNCSVWKAEINGFADKVWPEFESYVMAFVNTMASTREMIYEKVADVNENQVQYGRQKFGDFYYSLSQTEKTVLDVEVIRRQAYVGIFAIPLLPVALYVLCYFLGCLGCKKLAPLLFTLTYSIAWLVSILMFIILAIHLPIAAGLQDFCGFLSRSEENFEKAMAGDDWNQQKQMSINSTYGTMGKMMDACIQDTNLAETFNVTDQLEFGTAIKFPDLDVAALFNFQGWGNQTAYIKSRTFTDNGIYAPLAIETDTNCSVYFEDFKAGMNAVDSVILNVETSASDIYTDMSDVKTIFTPVLTAGKNILNQLKCGYVGGVYWSVRNNTCDGILTSMAMMCAAMAVNAIMLVILTIVGCKTRKQFKEPEDGVDLSENMEIAV